MDFCVLIVAHSNLQITFHSLELVVTSGVTTMVADTAMLRGPAVLGGPSRPTIKNIVGKKCELFY